MRVCGADLGVQNNKLTVALLETQPEPKVIDHQRLDVSEYMDRPWFPRLTYAIRLFSAILAQWQPECMCYEAAFLDKNPHVTIQLTTVGSMLGGVAVAAGIPVVRVYPAQAKQALTGNGQSDKKAMVHWANLLFRLELGKTDDDIADAIAIALYGESVYRLFDQAQDGEVLLP